MRAISMGLFCAFSLAAPAFGDDADRVAKLEAEVADLRRIVTDLEASHRAAPADPASEYRSDPAAQTPTLQIRGFAHAQYDFSGVDGGSGGSTNYFTNGGVDLFITSQISERWSFLSENVFEFTEEGESVLDVERVLLKFDYAEWLHVSAGRGHLPLGFWNQRYHHGTFLQTTVERPLVYGFEDDGGVLPVHFVGLEFGGDVEVGSGFLSYAANVANGRGRALDSVQVIEDRNDSKMVSLLLTWHPTGDEGVGFGANAIRDRIPADAASGRTRGMDETIVGAHAFYLQPPWELLIEGFWIGHDDELAARRLDHFGGYAQVAFTRGALQPYYRFDLLRIADSDPFFGGLVDDSDQHTAGVRFNLNKFVASKFEYRRVERGSIDSNEAAAQLSFAF